MAFDLSFEETRVLGALAEKDMATPEYYPLTLNALVNACNQKNNREPVTAYDDSTVRDALEALRQRSLVAFVSEAGSRVEKYRHKLSEHFNFSRGELAILTVLMLRGAQTVGELRGRTERLHPFDDLEGVERTLEKLAEREPEPLVRQLPRVPGTKEPRWVHLLSGAPETAPAEVGEEEQAPRRGAQAQIDELREEVSRLREDLDELRRKLEPLL